MMRTEGVLPVPRWVGLLIVALELMTVALGFSVLLSATPAGGSVAPAERPKLVVILMVDQFRADYLERFRDRFGKDGFQRLLREGAYFSSCYYPYAVTVTAAGHASVATGATPNLHGIIANVFYDERTGKRVAAVTDRDQPLVGGRPGAIGASPARLIGSTLGNEIHLALGGKVFGVALKNRSAVFATGHGADGAYWFDTATGRFVTSRYYRKDLPGWVKRFNREKGADRYYGRAWKVGGRVVRSGVSSSGRPDSGFYSRLIRTPYGNDLVLGFTQELVRRERLGTDDKTDFLYVGFSANDYVGHDWGPYSKEVADMAKRTDRQVAALLRFLDKQAGRGRYWLVMTADHGASPSIKQARRLGLPAVNIPRGALRATMEEALVGRWGEGPWLDNGTDNFRFIRETLVRHGVTREQAARTAGEAATKVEGVLGYVSERSWNVAGEIAERYRLSYFPGRSSDIVIVKKPYAQVGGENTGGHHGTPYSYDRHVPLLFFGPPFRPGVYPEEVAPTDIVPTLAALLQINRPTLASGRVLTEALRTTGREESKQEE